MSRYLGIDCGESVVRTALIRTSYRKVKLEALGEAPITPIEGGESAAIRHAVGALKPDACSIALNGSKCFFRKVKLPAAAQKDLANVLTFELESTVPLEMDSLIFDHRVLPGETRESLSIFAAIARIADVENRIQTVQAALTREPEVVGSGALPLASLGIVMPELTGATPGSKGAANTEPLAVLELGESTSELIILIAGEPVFVRTMSRGTRGLPGTAPHLARELRQSFAGWRASGGEPVSKMYLVGGGATVQGAELYLSTEVGVSIVPLPEPALEGITPEQKAKLPEFAKALGLALSIDGRAKSLNLRQGALEAARSYPFLREKVPLLSGLGAVIAVSFGFSVIAELRSLDAERAQLDAQLATIGQQVLGEEIEDVGQAQTLLEKGPGGGSDDPLPKVDAFDVMVELSKAVPRDVIHDVAEFDVSSSAAGTMQATIQGTVPIEQDAQKTAETIASAMRKHECLQNVKVAGTTQFNKERQKYTIEMDLRCEEKKQKKQKKGEAGPDSTANAEGGK